MGKFDQKVALVTGAGGGLGRAYALLLAKEGARVVVNDLGGARDGAGQGTAMADTVVAEIREAGGEAVANYGSVANPEDAEAMVQDAIKHFGRIDIVINNAGILRDKTLVRLEEAMWDLVLEVHLKGTFLVTKAAVTAMQRAGHGGRIINTTSYAGLKGNFGQSNYGAAKAGIAGFTRVVALETGKYGITCNAIAPVAKTRMTEDISMVPSEFEPDDIAPLVVWLASEAAADVTGRIFGAHGSHYFEYRMEMTPGVDLGTDAGAEKWTLDSVGERFEKITEREAAAKGAPGSGDEAQNQVTALLQALPGVFKAQKAKDWKANIDFDIKGTGVYSLTVADAKAVYRPGACTNADAKISFESADILLQMASGKLAPEQAFMAGKISSNNMGVLMSFAKYFDLGAAARRAASGESAPAPGGAASSTTAVATQAKDEADGLNLKAAGKQFKHSANFVKADEIIAYAKATENLNPRHVDLAREGGIVAPPLFAVQPLFAVLGAALTDKELNADLLRLVHGEQDMRFYKPLKPWDLVAPRGEITSIEEKSSGHLVNVRQWLMCDGELVCEAISGLFVKASYDPSRPKTAKASTPQPEPPERTIIYEESQFVAPDQSLRYADASGDHNPIHKDPIVARAAGLNDVILHGLCTMAFAARAIVDGICDGDSGLLRRFKVRFARPVYPESILTTRVWREEESDGVITYGLETFDQDGTPILTHGLAEVAK